MRREQQGPEILVPAIDKEDDGQRGDVGERKRQQDIAQEFHGRGAVELGGLAQIFGHGHEKLPEQEHRRCRRDERQRQARIGVDQVPVKACIDGVSGEHFDQKRDAGCVHQPADRPGHVGHRFIGWQDAHLDRQHERHEDQPEGGQPEGKPKIGDGKASKDRQDDLAHHDAGGNDERVDKGLPEIGGFPCDRQVLEKHLAGHHRHGDLLDGLPGVRAGHEGEIERRANDDRPDDQDDVADDSEDGTTLDHG